MVFFICISHDIKELCNFYICQTKDKCSSFHMILFHLCVSLLSLILLVHQDYWASEISLFSVVSTSVEGSVCPQDSWRSSSHLCPKFSPLHAGFCLAFLLFWPSGFLFVCLFFAFYLPHLSQPSLAIVCNWRSGDCFLLFAPQVQKACGPVLLSMCHVALWTESWLGPSNTVWFDGLFCYLMLGIIRGFLFVCFCFGGG